MAACRYLDFFTSDAVVSFHEKGLELLLILFPPDLYKGSQQLVRPLFSVFDLAT